MAIIEDRRRKERATDGLDRRRFPRICVPLDGVFFGKSRSLEVTKGNMTLRGFFIRTLLPERPGSRGVLRLSSGGNSVMLKFDVEVVWANDDPSVSAAGMGLRICAQQDWQRKRMAACLLRRAGLSAFPSLGRK